MSQNAKDLSHLDHTCQIFPASHYDVAKASANARVARLRSAHDHLISVRRDRKRALRAKMVRISDRIRADDYCLMQLNRGEQTLVTLDKRLESVRVALAESAAEVDGVQQWPYRAVAPAFEVIPFSAVTRDGEKWVSKWIGNVVDAWPAGAGAGREPGS